MPKTSVVPKLPPDVLSELNARLRACNFGDFDAHSEWLKSKGFSISKSAIHRYSCEHKEEINFEPFKPGYLAMMNIRVRCLDIAGRLTNHNPDLITKKADELVAWVASA